MQAIDILTHGDFEDVNVFKDGQKVETMSKGKAILTIGNMDISDFWIQNDAIGCLNICIYLK